MLASSLGQPTNPKDSICLHHLAPPSSKNYNEILALLAKTLSLQRADKRAKHPSSATSSANSLLEDHRFFPGTDVSCCLSSFKAAKSTIVSRKSEGGNCNIGRAGTDDINDMGVPLLEHRTGVKELDLWTAEISSISSYGSDDKLSTSKSESMLELQTASTCSNSASCKEKGFALQLLDTLSATDSDTISTDLRMSCTRCSCNDPILGENRRVLESTSISDHKRAIEKNRGRRHSSSSISAALPADIRGEVGDSIPLVKISCFPYDDFRESMYEMIVEKKLQKSLDLEELLYCYLTLNSPEHHQLIHEVFTDVWSAILMMK